MNHDIFNIEEHKILIEFGCGCILPVDYPRYVFKRSNGCVQCVKHRKRAIGKHFICHLCGKHSYTKKTQRNPYDRYLCSPECKKKSHSLNYKNYIKQLGKTTEKDTETIENIELKPKLTPKLKKRPMVKITHPDCKFYLKCLDMICRDAKATHVNCRDCHRYQILDIDVMEYLRASDVMDKAIFVECKL